MSSTIVAVVGRPNVGKSTFFNRLIQRRDAIVDSVSGVTRDRHYGKSEWNGREFSVIDTDGVTSMDEDVANLLRKVKKPVLLAVNKVDNAMRVNDALEFYNLGLGDYFTIASINDR